MFREQFGDLFMDYFINLKRAELDRYRQFVTDEKYPNDVDGVTQWEQDEYFDAF